MNLPQRLMEVEFIMHSQKKSLNGINLGFSISWNLEINLFEVNHTVLRFDQFSVEICLAKNSEKDLDSEIRQFSSELNLVITVSALITVEGSDDNFSEEGNFGEEDGGGS